jgi:hypothetical protein
MRKFQFILILISFYSVSGFAQQIATINQSEQLRTIVAIKTTIDKSNKTSKYKIQLANGSKGFIDKTLGLFYAEFPNTPAHKVYESPEYKVRVGNYRTKLEAERALIRIRKKFPNAIIVKL